MRNFCVYLLTPFITVCNGILKIKGVEEYLDKSFQHGSAITSWVVVASTLLLYYLTIYSPYRQLQKRNAVLWKVFSFYLDTLMQSFGQYQLTFNIMVPRRRFLHSIEPRVQGDVNDSRKKRLFGRILKPIWAHPRTLNNGFKLTINQGLAGNIFKSGQDQFSFTVFKHPQKHPGDKNFNFNKKQLHMTESIVMVGSIAINSIKSGSNGQEKKTLGVLNVESNHQSVVKLFDEDSRKLQLFTSAVTQLANICGMLIEE